LLSAAKAEVLVIMTSPRTISPRTVMIRR
jgi:hypothetical protein